MATITAGPSMHDRKLKALREAAKIPEDPMHEDAVRVLKRRAELVAEGWEDEPALDRALAEGQVVDETAGA